MTSTEEVAEAYKKQLSAARTRYRDTIQAINKDASERRESAFREYELAIGRALDRFLQAQDEPADAGGVR